MAADQHGQRTAATTDATTSDIATSARILVVTPVRLLRDGLAGMLQRRYGASAVCTASGAESAVVALKEFGPTLVLLDVATGDGLDIAAALNECARNVLILGFAARAHDHDLLAYAKAGISAFVPREASTPELFRAISRAARGELVCSPRLTAAMFRKLAELATTQAPAAPVATESMQLTDREREIVCCIDEGQSNKQIARHLRIKISTVKHHVHNILEKLNVTRRGEAAARVRTISPALPSIKESSIRGSILP